MTPDGSTFHQSLEQAVAAHGGRIDSNHGTPRWWLSDPNPDAIAAARELWLTETRRLHQMKRPLPIIFDDPVLPTRAFRREDAESWLDINNAAFGWHPDQGNWTLAMLEERMTEPWFEMEGFRIAAPATGNGPIEGFCWTKVHPAGTEADHAVGEIYVIAVAPTHQGRGFGRRLTLAGLDWLWRHARTPEAMLYVESSNAAAIATYQRLGFEITRTDHAFERATQR